MSRAAIGAAIRKKHFLLYGCNLLQCQSIGVTPDDIQFHKIRAFYLDCILFWRKWNWNLVYKSDEIGNRIYRQYYWWKYVWMDANSSPTTNLEDVCLRVFRWWTWYSTWVVPLFGAMHGWSRPLRKIIIANCGPMTIDAGFPDDMLAVALESYRCRSRGLGLLAFVLIQCPMLFW